MYTEQFILCRHSLLGTPGGIAPNLHDDSDTTSENLYTNTIKNIGQESEVASANDIVTRHAELNRQPA